jgi:hypothetical protein
MGKLAVVATIKTRAKRDEYLKHMRANATSQQNHGGLRRL